MSHDIFISYRTEDRRWAEWIAWTLEDAGYSTVIQSWDFHPGANFVVEMQRLAHSTEWTIAVLSASYVESLSESPSLKDDVFRVLPVRVEPCELPQQLERRDYLDFVGLGEHDARESLLRSIAATRAKPMAAPMYPGPQASRTEPRFPTFFPHSVGHRFKDARENALKSTREPMSNDAREYPWHNVGLLAGVAAGYAIASILSLDEASVAIVSLTLGVTGLWLSTLALRHRNLRRLWVSLTKVFEHE